MKIRGLHNLLAARAEPMVLRDATVVVDGHNFFFNSYEDSGLTHQLGCDSLRYAAYLRQQLAIFRKANVKCYFLLKGGHENMRNMTFENKHPHVTIRPIFMKDICREVLEEMGIEYVVCEYESKKDITALAQTLNCPVISHDTEFFFTGLQCLLKKRLKFNERDNSINCNYTSLKNFMNQYRLSKKKLALFIVLSDEHIFRRGFFLDLFRHLNAPADYFKRYLRVIYWLSKNSKEELLGTIFRFIYEDEDKNRFVQEVDTAELMLGRREAGGRAAARLLRRSGNRDGDWFSAGVADNHVAIDYINLYRSQVFFGSHAITPPPGQDDAMVLSLDIIKYAYDLLTNFQNKGFTFVYDTETERRTMHVEGHPIRRPDYEEDVCVFENGWSDVRHLGLFEHFLKESLQRSEVRALGFAPRAARLLLAALLYYSRRRADAGADSGADAEANALATDARADTRADTRAETRADVAAVLLSYVMLSHVLDKIDNSNLPKPPFVAKPIENPTTDKDDITGVDRNIAAAIMSDYVTVSEDEIEGILDPELLHPLVEFQQCLSQLSDLNALCGGALPRPALRGACAGPLVYKLRRAMAGAAARAFLNTLLSPAPTVLAFLNGLIDLYELMSS